MHMAFDLALRPLYTMRYGVPLQAIAIGNRGVGLRAISYSKWIVAGNEQLANGLFGTDVYWCP